MEVRVAIDTNRLTDLFRGDQALAEWLDTCDETWIPLTVLGEIKAGFLGGTKVARNEALLRQFLAEPTAGVLLPTRETADAYARLHAQLRRAGTPIPDNDLWIAAQAVEHDLALITRDKHFRKIAQLSLNPDQT